MPRVHTARASKDYPDHGIAKGDTYYHWAFFRGPVQRSKTPPRQSQITASPNLSAAYSVTEDLEDAVAAATTPEEVKLALEEAASAADGVMSDYDETIGNLENAFTGGCPALEAAQEQRDALEEFKDACESAATEVESLDFNDYEVKPDTQPAEGGVAWDDLTEEGQEEMLDAARELANEPAFEF